MGVILDIAFYSEPRVNTLAQILHKHRGSWEHYRCLPQDVKVYVIKFADFTAQQQIGNVTIDVLPMPSFLQLNYFLKTLISEKKPKLIITHSLLYPLKHLLLQTSLSADSKIAVQLHADGIRRNPLLRLLQQMAYKKCDYVFITGKEQLLPFYAKGVLSEQSRVIELMEGSCAFSAQEKPAKSQKTKLLWVGRFIAGKDVTTFITACALLKKRGFLFSGELISSGGPLLEEIRKKIEDYNLQNELSISLNVDHGQMQDKYNSADLFISTSLREGSGWALCEAMACGLAPIVTGIPSYKWMTKNGSCGAVVECGNAQELAQAIATCEVNSGTIGKQARLVFEQRLSFNAIANTIYNLLKM